MAFKLGAVQEKIKVIARVDDAIDFESYEDFEEVYKDYLETLDESLLKFVEGKQPTRFVLKKSLKYSEHYNLRSKQFKQDKKGETSINAAFTFDEVRMCLVDIENPLDEPDCISYKADGSGGASIETMEKLISAGIADDLYAALNFSKKNAVKSFNKKN